MAPRTKYARNGDVSIAYQVVGDGPIDLVHGSGSVSHVEYVWEEPRHAHYLRRLAAFSRLILFDKRGTGLSDRSAGIASMEERMDDVRAVMDAAGSQLAFLCGVSESAALMCLFAATYPERTAALILYAAYASEVRKPDYPWPPTAEEFAADLDELADYDSRVLGERRLPFRNMRRVLRTTSPSAPGSAPYCDWARAPVHSWPSNAWTP